jgi:hypothetical protein
MPDTATLAVATAQTATGADAVGNLSAVAAGTTAPTSTHAGTGGSNSVSAPAATLVNLSSSVLRIVRLSAQACMTNCLHWARWSPRDEELEFRVAPRCAGDDEVAAYFEVIDQSGHVLADEFKVAVSAGRIGGSAGESRFVPELFGLHLTQNRVVVERRLRERRPPVRRLSFGAHPLLRLEKAGAARCRGVRSRRTGADRGPEGLSREPGPPLSGSVVGRPLRH